MLKRVYVWEFPVRLTHWVNAWGIVVLAVTGFYIGSPFIHATDNNAFIMAKMRFVHFIAAYVSLLTFLIRVYWSFVGNSYARWDQFIPLSAERRKNLMSSTSFYCFLREQCPKVIGHTGLAGLAYLILFVLFLFEILTGFALYSLSHVGLFWTMMGGWLFVFFTEGTLRLVHHCIMWLIVSFALLHVYIGHHNDMIEKNGLMSSIFSGYKTIEE